MKNKIRNTYIYRFLLILSLLINVYACKPSGEDNDLQNEHANSYLTDEEIDGYEAWKQEQSAYKSDRQNLVREANDKMERLEAQVDKLSPENQVKVREDIKKMEASRIELENKLNELETANEENWSRVKKEVDQLADSLELSIEEIDKNVEFGSIWLIF